MLGNSNTIKIIFLFLLSFLLLLNGCQSGHNSNLSESNDVYNTEVTLLAYVAAGIREPLEEIASLYSQQYGVNVNFVFNNSGRLLSQAELSSQGDIYLSSDDYFMNQAINKNLIARQEQVAFFVPAIVVQQDNPLNIKNMNDLTEPGLEIIVCEESTAMGRAAKHIFENNQLTESITPNISARVATAPQVALNIALGQGDAGITGRNSVGEMSNKLEVITIPPEQNFPTSISAGVLSSSTNPDQALDLLEFMTSPEGQQIFINIYQAWI